MPDAIKLKCQCGNETEYDRSIDPSIPIEVVRIESTECDQCEADDGGFGSETWFDAAGNEVAQD